MGQKGRGRGGWEKDAGEEAKTAFCEFATCGRLAYPNSHCPLLEKPLLSFSWAHGHAKTDFS